MTTRPPTTVSVGWPLWERSIIASVLGLPGYAAIGIALGFTGLGVFIDLERINGLGTIFKGCYFTGCLVSICWVKRRALFGPMVQPPLLLAVAVPGVVLAADGGASSSGLAARLLAIGTPLLNGFPTMAVTTAFVVSIGIVRYLVQKPDPEAERIRAETVAALASQRPVERSRAAAEPRRSDQPRPSDPPRPSEAIRPADAPRSSDAARPPERTGPPEPPRPSEPPRGRDPQRSPDPVRTPDRSRTPERRPPGSDPSEDPTSILPTSGPDGPGPAGQGPGQPDGRPPHPPRKSDLHRAQRSQNRPT